MLDPCGPTTVFAVGPVWCLRPLVVAELR